jgi:flagellar M-ring protein FliF
MESLTTLLGSWSPAKRWSFALVAALVITASTWAFWKVSNPEFAQLPLRFDPADAGKIVDALESAKIPFELNEDGTQVRVPVPRLNDARARLAADGLPSGGRVGFETFDESSLGATDFAQRVNLQRALQGELERSIETLLGMDGVRVHLSLSASRGLLQDRREAKASVIVPQDHLSASQIRSIQGVVAGAVEGLSTSAVSVVGRDGNALSLGGDSWLSSSLAESTEDLRAREEARVHQRLIQMLSGFVARSDIRLSVSVELEIEHREMQRKVEGGTPGTAIGATSSAGQAEAGNALPGTAGRVSIAVVMPEPAVEREAIEHLIAATAGLNTERGDRLALLYHQPAAIEGGAAELPILNPSVSEGAEVQLDVLPQSPVSEWNLLAALLGIVAVVALLLMITHKRRGARAQDPVVDSEAALARARAWLVHGSR